MAQRASKKLDASLERVVKIAEAKDAVVRAAKEWRAMCWTPKERDANLRKAVARLEKLEAK